MGMGHMVIETDTPAIGIPMGTKCMILGRSVSIFSSSILVSVM